MKITTHHQINKPNKKLYGLLISILISLSGISQNVSISSIDTLPNAAAGLDVYFSNKGLLIPRIALTGTANYAPLSAHVAGMIVYNTATVLDVIPGFYYDDGTKWVTGFPKGSNQGDMLYWNGTAWVKIPVGTSGQYLQLSTSNVPIWGGGSFVSISTSDVIAIGGSIATCGGNITNDGGFNVISRGVCWNTVTGPTIENTKTTDGSGPGSFTSSITGLTPATAYFVRAYAMNRSNITYGNEISFTTSLGIPVLGQTNAATLISGTSATSGGNVTSTEGTTITEWGLCYATNPNPSIADSKLLVASPGTGAFTGTLNGLTGNTIYYVKSFATNNFGNTAYGTEISFTTLVNNPVVFATGITNIEATTATVGCTYTINGTGGYVMAQGAAYSLIPNGGDGNRSWAYDANGSLTSPVTVNFTGLSPNTTYYIVGWVNYMNTVTGVGYSERSQELSFTTKGLLQTSPITSVTGTSAVSGGTYSTVGGSSSIQTRGVCWSTSTGPTVGLTTKTVDGSGTGTFVSNISGLDPGTQYFVRAYCTDNLNVTVYGDEFSFSTVPIAIGDALYGGKVVYIDSTGKHGLIGALNDLFIYGIGATYGCWGSSSGAFGTAIYSGLANTNLIISKCGTSTAAGLCSTYTVGGINIPGVTNWYLPSLFEMKAMIDANALSLDISYQWQGSKYWTSTEDSTNPTGYAFYLYSGTYALNATDYKDQYCRVRAVRTF